jgi:hypothetical protein
VKKSFPFAKGGGKKGGKVATKGPDGSVTTQTAKTTKTGYGSAPAQSAANAHQAHLTKVGSRPKRGKAKGGFGRKPNYSQ